MFKKNNLPISSHLGPFILAQGAHILHTSKSISNKAKTYFP